MQSVLECQNDDLRYSQISPILPLKLLAMAMTFDKSQNEIPLYQVSKPFHTPTNPENLVMIGLIDSEIWGLEVDHYFIKYRKKTSENT